MRINVWSFVFFFQRRVGCLIGEIVWKAIKWSSCGSWEFSLKGIVFYEFSSYDRSWEKNRKALNCLVRNCKDFGNYRWENAEMCENFWKHKTMLIWRNTRISELIKDCSRKISLVKFLIVFFVFNVRRERSTVEIYGEWVNSTPGAENTLNIFLIWNEHKFCLQNQKKTISSLLSINSKKGNLHTIFSYFIFS